MIIVIADDFTGAAELAGIGLRYGLRVKILTDLDQLVNAELVRLGYANVTPYPPDTKYHDDFMELEKYALTSKLGIHGYTPEIKPPPLLQ